MDLCARDSVTEVGIIQCTTKWPVRTAEAPRDCTEVSYSVRSLNFHSQRKDARTYSKSETENRQRTVKLVSHSKWVFVLYVHNIMNKNSWNVYPILYNFRKPLFIENEDKGFVQASVRKHLVNVHLEEREGDRTMPLRWTLEEEVWGEEIHGIGSGSYSMVSFNTKGSEVPRFTTRLFISYLLGSWMVKPL